MQVHNVYVVRKLVGNQPCQKCFRNLALFIFPSACNSRAPDHQFFLISFHEVKHHKIRKLVDPIFGKKVQMGQEGSKSPKNAPKMRFLGFHQNISIQICFLASMHGSKNNMLGKNIVLELWFKNL